MNFKKFLIVYLSGFLAGVCFLIPEISYGIFIALVPFIYIVFNTKLTLKQGFRVGLTFGVSMYLVVASFIFTIYPLELWGVSNLLSLLFVIFAYLFIAFYEATFMGLMTMLFVKIKKNNIVNVFLFAGLFTLMEFVLSLGMFGFTFGHLYTTQHQNLPIIQSASYLSCYFISFLILVISGLLALLRKGNIKYLIIAIAIFILNFSYGLIRIENYDDSGEKVKVSIIQGNISTISKWENGNTMKIFEKYKSLTEQAVKNDQPKIVVWPETTIPISLKEDSQLFNMIRDIAISNEVMLITGAFTYNDIKKADYNSIVIFDKEGNLLSPVYNKRHLVPMGEYVPFEKFFKMIFGEKSQDDYGILKGNGTNVVPTPYGNISGLICFDSIFPHLAKESIKDGGNLITIVTNDSWFKSSFGVYAHAAQAVFRAVENNRYVVRCANTGISAFISPTGEIIKSIPPLEEGYISYEVSFK